MAIPIFGQINEAQKTRYIAYFEHFYYELVVMKGIGLAISLMDKPDRAPTFTEITKANFEMVLNASVKRLTNARSTISQAQHQFVFYHRKVRLSNTLFAIYSQKREAFILDLGSRTDNPIEKSLSFRQDYDNNERDNASKMIDYPSFMKGWDNFNDLVRALMKDIQRPPESFRQSVGLTNSELTRLKKLCRQNKVHFNVEDNYPKPRSIRIAGMRFTQFETAAKAIDALIKEKTFTYSPSYNLRSGFDLPF